MVDVVVALKTIAPPALMLRAVVAVAVWRAKVSAIAAPRAADPLELVSPCAVVFAVACVVAVKVALPEGDCCGPGFVCAALDALLMASATAGAMVTPPPDAPVFAVVVIELDVVADAAKS